MVASVGEAAVSAVSLVDSINILMLNIFAALATGGAIVASQYLGQRDEKNANRSAKQLVVVVALFGLALGLLCALLRAPLLRGLFGSADAAVLSDAQNYFFFTALSYPFIAVYNSGAAIFRSMGNSKVSLKASLISNVINIIGNAICIYGLGWGVVGAAVPTLISRIVGAVLILWLLRNRDKWPQYETAVDAMLQKTSTTFAPWRIIESTDKKYARVRVLEEIIAALEDVL